MYQVRSLHQFRLKLDCALCWCHPISLRHEHKMQTAALLHRWCSTLFYSLFHSHFGSILISMFQQGREKWHTWSIVPQKINEKREIKTGHGYLVTGFGFFFYLRCLLQSTSLLYTISVGNQRQSELGRGCTMLFINQQVRNRTDHDMEDIFWKLDGWHLSKRLQTLWLVNNENFSCTLNPNIWCHKICHIYCPYKQ